MSTIIDRKPLKGLLHSIEKLENPPPPAPGEVEKRTISHVNTTDLKIKVEHGPLDTIITTLNVKTRQSERIILHPGEAETFPMILGKLTISRD